MELLFNELSFHGQFTDLESFREAIGRVMLIRQVARRFGRQLPCHRNILGASITANMIMPQAVQALSANERSALLQWVTRDGPFWEDERGHGEDEWFEHAGVVVTDSAVGEAAWCRLNKIDQRLVSITPSLWNASPVPVDHVPSNGAKQTVQVENYWASATLEAQLQAVSVPLGSWDELRDVSIARCGRIIFGTDAFQALQGHPFVPSAARRLLFLLDRLNHFRGCFSPAGERTPEGHSIYRDYFTGKREAGGRGAIFSDSSDSEKNEFSRELTFRHPADVDAELFCPWHGKVQTPQLRFHFSYPIAHNEQLYVVYVGPKITKR